MADPRELRNKRLDNEHKELMQINGELIKIEPIGKAPFEKYEITFNFRTLVRSARRYSDKTICTLTIPPGYPQTPPSIQASAPHPNHPNWYSGGRWCYGRWSTEESLVNYVLRCARTLQHDPAISAHSSEGRQFWEENKRNNELILNDPQLLSTFDALEAIVIHKREIPKIEIIPRTEKPMITILKGEDLESEAPKITIIKKKLG
jgi:ubiquitin-protein ligase